MTFSDLIKRDCLYSCAAADMMITDTASHKQCITLVANFRGLQASKINFNKIKRW